MKDLVTKNTEDTKKAWPMVRLGDVCEVLADGDWIESKDQSETGIRLIQTGNIGNGVFERKDNRARYISDATFLKLNCTEIYSGDVLISRLPEPVGRACIVEDIGCRMITAVDCSIVRFKNEIDPKFFIQYSQSAKYQSQISSQLTGTTRARISRKHLSSVLIPCPSLTVQHAIVARLEKELGEADKLAAKFKRIVQLADDEFKAELDETFKTIKGEKVRLGDVCERLSSGKFIAASRIKPEGEIPVFGANGLRGYAELSNFYGECVIVGRQGALRGNVRHYKGYAYMTDHAIVATFKPIAESIFMMHQLGYMNLGRLSKQAAQPGLAVSVLAIQRIVLPPLVIQREIVAKLDAAKERCEKLKAAALRGLAAAEKLRKAILAEAFEQ